MSRCPIQAIQIIKKYRAPGSSIIVGLSWCQTVINLFVHEHFAWPMLSTDIHTCILVFVIMVFLVYWEIHSTISPIWYSSDSISITWKPPGTRILIKFMELVSIWRDTMQLNRDNGNQGQTFRKIFQLPRRQFLHNI